MLKGVDPDDNEQVKQILDKLSLKDFKGTVDELKKYIADAMRTGSAKQIRENIKYLNEKRKKPTQENLGITYIQRDEDEAADKVKTETELYKVFTMGLNTSMFRRHYGGTMMTLMPHARC